MKKRPASTSAVHFIKISDIDNEFKVIKFDL